MSAPTLSYSEGRHFPADKAMIAGARIYYAMIALDPPPMGPLVDADVEDPHPDSEYADMLIRDAQILGLEAHA